MLSLISTYGIEKIINLTTLIRFPFLINQIHNPEFGNWMRLNGIVNIGSSYLYDLVHLVKFDIVTQYKVLELTNYRFLLARVMYIYLQLQNVSKNNLLIKDYFMKIKSIIDHLLTIGKTLFYQDVIMCIVRGLDANYLTFISYISMRFGSFSFDEF